MTSHSRRLGRLFCCLLALSAATWCAEPGKTLVSDVVYRADGTPASGTLVISWPAFTTATGNSVAAGSLSVKIGNDGAVNIPLVPTQGATPAGTSYKVTLSLSDGSSSQENWSVPTQSPTTIAAIRSTVVPASVAMQVVSRDYVDTALANAIKATGDEIVAGTKTFATSPLVPSPTTAAAAVNKDYVDQSVALAAAGGGTGILALNKGGTAQNAWVSGRCVRVANDGSSLESAAGDCNITSNADTVDGQHASAFQPVLPNSATLGKISESAGLPQWNGAAWPGGTGGSGDAITIRSKSVDAPTAAGQQFTYNGTKIVAQAKPVVDIRDIAGVDCTGATDSSVALNALTDGTNNAVNGARISFLGCPLIRLDHTWTIKYFVNAPAIDLGPKHSGTSIFGCIRDSAPADLSYLPLVLFSRTGKPTLHGGSTEAFGGATAGRCGTGGISNATVNIGVENDFTTYPSGVTTTQGRFYDHAFFPNKGGTKVNGWTGLYIGGSKINTQNLEGMSIDHNQFSGNDSQGSYGVQINSRNSDHGLMTQNTFNNLNYAVKHLGPYWTFTSNVYTSVADARVYTTAGCVVQADAAHLTFINEESAESTGQYLCETAGGSNLSYVQMIGGYLGGEDGGLAAGASNIDLGSGNGDFTFIGVRGQNLGGAPIVGGGGANTKIHSLGNRWLSQPFAIDTAKGVYYDNVGDSSIGSRINTNLGLTLQTILGGNYSSAAHSPALNFEHTGQISHAVSNYAVANVGADGGNTSALQIVQSSGAAGVLVEGPQIAGGISTVAATARTIASVTPVGGTGATSWGYSVVAYANNGLMYVYPSVSMSNGIATLDATHYNHIEIKTNLKWLLGDGKPGYLQELSARVDRHERLLQRFAGLGTAIAGLLTILHIGLDYFRGH